MVIAFTFTSIGTIGNLISFLRYGLLYGGPAVLLWGWIIIGFFSMTTGI
jgi:hypothetical protein